jgi:predicted NBD/HSP70 family sugar kinase
MSYPFFRSSLEYTCSMASSYGAGSQRSLRARNADLILRTLLRLGPLAQAELAVQTTLSHATISNIVSTLTTEGTVSVETGQRNGRQAKIVHLLRSTASPVSLGLAVGRTDITGVACETDGTQLVSVHRPRTLASSYEVDLDTLSDIVTEIRSHPNLANRSVLGVGVSLATWVDFDRGCIPPDCDWYGFPAQSGWPGAPLRTDLSARVDLPVHVDSDGNAATISEVRWGAARGYTNVVYVRIVEGVTGGLVLNDRLYRGERGLAGSLGHSTADPAGRVCVCGSRGCLETYLHPDALLEPLRHLHSPDLTPTQVAERAAAGDDGCARIIVDAAKRLGIALANVISVLVPQCIVIAGDLAPAGTILTEALDQSLRSFMPSMFRPGIIMTAQHAGSAAEGAAALVFEEEPPFAVPEYQDGQSLATV